MMDVKSSQRSVRSPSIFDDDRLAEYGAELVRDDPAIPTRTGSRWLRALDGVRARSGGYQRLRFVDDFLHPLGVVLLTKCFGLPSRSSNRTGGSPASGGKPTQHGKPRPS
jgi:hypothetical protein